MNLAKEQDFLKYEMAEDNSRGNTLPTNMN